MHYFLLLFKINGLTWFCEKSRIEGKSRTKTLNLIIIIIRIKAGVDTINIITGIEAIDSIIGGKTRNRRTWCQPIICLNLEDVCYNIFESIWWFKNILKILYLTLSKSHT